MVHAYSQIPETAGRPEKAYPIHAKYEDQITDLDDKDKKVIIELDATQEGFAMTVHNIYIKPIDQFVMTNDDIKLSVLNAIELSNPRTYIECNPVVIE